MEEQTFNAMGDPKGWSEGWTPTPRDPGEPIRPEVFEAPGGE